MCVCVCVRTCVRECVCVCAYVPEHVYMHICVMGGSEIWVDPMGLHPGCSPATLM